MTAPGELPREDEGAVRMGVSILAQLSHEVGRLGGALEGVQVLMGRQTDDIHSIAKTSERTAEAVERLAGTTDDHEQRLGVHDHRLGVVEEEVAVLRGVHEINRWERRLQRIMRSLVRLGWWGAVKIVGALLASGTLVAWWVDRS